MLSVVTAMNASKRTEHSKPMQWQTKMTVVQLGCNQQARQRTQSSKTSGERWARLGLMKRLAICLFVRSFVRSSGGPSVFVLCRVSTSQRFTLPRNPCQAASARGWLPYLLASTVTCHPLFETGQMDHQYTTRVVLRRKVKHSGSKLCFFRSVGRSASQPDSQTASLPLSIVAVRPSLRSFFRP